MDESGYLKTEITRSEIGLWAGHAGIQLADANGRAIDRTRVNQLHQPGLPQHQTMPRLGLHKSRADFIHKLRMVLKELTETKSWLEQIVANGLYSRDKMGAIKAENQELCFTIAASIRNARRPQSPV